MMSFMRQTLPVLIAVLSFTLISSCAKKAATGPHATVTLRDGTTFSGMVTATSTRQIVVEGDDKRTTRVFDMKDVRSVDYDEQAAAAPAPTQDAAQPTDATEQHDADEARRHAESHSHPEESAIRTKTYLLPAGTRVPVRTEETIDSARAAEGQTYAAEVARDVLDADGQVVIPRGSNALIVIRSAAKGGHFRGTSDLVLDLQSVSVDGRQYQLSTADVVERGKDGIGKNKRTAKYVGSGAVIGTIIGAIAGHGKGAAIGAASGAGAGAAGQLVTRGGAIRVPAESVLTFKLDQPLQVVARQ
jgi:hypothetical protein